MGWPVCPLALTIYLQASYASYCVPAWREHVIQTRDPQDTDQDLPRNQTWGDLFLNSTAGSLRAKATGICDGGGLGKAKASSQGRDPGPRPAFLPWDLMWGRGESRSWVSPRHCLHWCGGHCGQGEGWRALLCPQEPHTRTSSQQLHFLLLHTHTPPTLLLSLGLLPRIPHSPRSAGVPCTLLGKVRGIPRRQCHKGFFFPPSPMLRVMKYI